MDFTLFLEPAISENKPVQKLQGQVASLAAHNGPSCARCSEPSIVCKSLKPQLSFSAQGMSRPSAASTATWFQLKLGGGGHHVPEATKAN
jgi:hypothetical protein